MTKYLTHKNVLYAVIAIMAILLFVSNCGKSKSKLSKEYKAKSDSIERKYNDSLGKLATDKTIAEMRYKVASADLHNKSIELDKSLKELAIYKSKTTQLAKQNQQAKKDNDTAKYIVSCDSLSIEVTAMNWVIGNLQNQIEEKDNIQRIKDSLNNIVLQNANQRFNLADKCCNEQKHLLDKLYSTTKPRNQLYIGGMINGSKSILLNGATGLIGFKTKTDKLYLGGLGIQTNGEPYGSVGIMIKIGKR